MCDGKEAVTMDGIPYLCCYNHYFNGATCVQCLAGFYGNDCSKKCNNGLYGERCGYKCNCSARQFCHHITGCIIEYSGSTEVPHRKLNESSKTDHTLAKSNSPVLPLTSTSTTTEVPHNGYESSNTNHTPVNYNSPLPPLTSTLSTSDIQFPRQTNIFIFAIGSVIALFLGILVVQFCIKLRIKRRKYTQQMSVKRKQVKEEETYNEINESIIGIEEDPLNEQRYFGRYFELQEQNQLTGVPYDKIKTQAHYQKINNSLVKLFCNSDSSNSDASYLNPKTNENHSYVDVMESSTAICGITIQDINVNSSNDSSNVSSLYLQPVHSIEKDETVLQSNLIGANDDEYFGVLRETIF